MIPADHVSPPCAITYDVVFSSPLGPGAYSVWIQDSSTGTFNYGFALQLDAVPEPATWKSSLAAVTCVGLLLDLRRRRRTSR
jgi:hypothetical protein